MKSPFDVSEPLPGPVVTLEPLAPAHRDGLAAIATTPELWAYMPIDAGTPEGFAAMFDAALAGLAAHTEFPYAVRLTDTGCLVGSTRFLNISVADAGLEIGWTWYARDHWGGVINPAAKRVLMGHAFERLGAERVGFRCDARNRRSHQAILRLGAVEEGVLRRHKRVQHGFLRDTVQFSVIAEEWPAVRDRLDARLAAAGVGGPGTQSDLVGRVLGLSPQTTNRS